MAFSIYDFSLCESVFSIDQIKESNKKILNVAYEEDDVGGLTQAAARANKTSIVTQFCIGELEKEIYETIISTVIETNKHIFGYDIFPITQHDTMNYNVYNKREEYEWHADGQKDGHFDIKLTCLVNFSEVPYEGGELILGINEGKGMGIKMEKFTSGSILVFSPHVYHRVTPVTKGRRITAALWAMGPKFR